MKYIKFSKKYPKIGEKLTIRMRDSEKYGKGFILRGTLEWIECRCAEDKNTVDFKFKEKSEEYWMSEKDSEWKN